MQHQSHRHIPCFWTDHLLSLQHRRLTQSVLSAFCHEPVLTQPGHKGGLAHSRLSNQQYLIRSHAPQILPSGLCSLSLLLWEGMWHHPRLVDWPVAIGKSGTIHLSRAAGGYNGRMRGRDKVNGKFPIKEHLKRSSSLYHLRRTCISTSVRSYSCSAS